MQCDVCGNEYARSFGVTMGEETFVFDCFECAVHKLAPECEHCGCKIIGHGVEAGDAIFCCDHCLRASGTMDEEDEEDEDLDEDEYEDDLEEEDEEPGRGGRSR
ncbi:MAG: hypothetical protein AB7P78_15365 [Candidatus Binatia bacterium]